MMNRIVLMSVAVVALFVKTCALLAVLLAGLDADAAEAARTDRDVLFTLGAEAFDQKGGHIQGVAASEEALYVAQMTWLSKVDWTGKVLKQVRVTSHTGDICWHDGELYAAVAVYPARTEGRIQVFDGNLNLLREVSVDRTIDGIACLDGVLYVGMGAKTQPSKNPHRVNVLGRFDAKTLKEIAPRVDFDYGYETRYGFQNICTDGTDLYGTFYAVKGAPPLVRFGRDLKILDTDGVSANQGFDVLPPAQARGNHRFVRCRTLTRGGRITAEISRVGLAAAPYFISHRGWCRDGAKENTRASFRRAGELGFQAIETDVWMTKDGVLVCNHDADLKRVFGRTEKIADIPYAAISNDVPSFAEYLDVCTAFHAIPFIETKGDKAVVAPVLEMVRARGLVDTAVMSAVPFDHIREVRRLDKRIYVHHIFTRPELLDEIAAMGNCGVSFNYPDPKKAPPELLARARRLGIRYCLRATDSPELLRAHRACGCAYYPTNKMKPDVKFSDLQ